MSLEILRGLKSPSWGVGSELVVNEEGELAPEVTVRRTKDREERT